jgi:hypothetical protein
MYVSRKVHVCIHVYKFACVHIIEYFRVQVHKALGRVFRSCFDTGLHARNRFTRIYGLYVLMFVCMHVFMHDLFE